LYGTVEENDDTDRFVWQTNKVYRQMPYTGKKLVPAKLRKDYWRPMAMIEFSPGLNEVGRSVFQKLREFKKRHELEWGRDDPEEEHRLLHMSKHERGKALNNQRPNSVADVAAVLGGVGKGTKMWMVDWNDLADKRVTVKKRGRDTVAVLQEAEKTNKKNLRLLAGMGISVEEAGERKFVDWQTITNLAVEVKGYKPAPEMPKKHPKEPKEGGQLVEGEALENEPKEGEKLVEAETQEKKPKEGEVPEKKPKAVRFVVDEESSIDLEPLKKLHTATIYWAKEQDLRYAREWTDNVEHVVGLPGDGTKRPHHLNRDGMKKWRAEKAARRGLPAVPEPASEIPQAASEVPQAAPVAA